MTRAQEVCIKCASKRELGSENDFFEIRSFGSWKKIVTSAVQDPNGDARLRTDVWHI